MTFAEIIPVLQEGKAVRRPAWACKGGFLALDSDIQGWFVSGNEVESVIVETPPVIWNDLIATDWQVVE